MKALGAVFGHIYGWERPNWFVPKEYELPKEEIGSGDVLLGHNHSPPLEDGRIVEKYSFRRSNYFPFVGQECRHVQEKVGLLDMSAFSKFMVSGPGAAAWLESLVCNRIPKGMGRIGLCHMLTLREAYALNLRYSKPVTTAITWFPPERWNATTGTTCSRTAPGTERFI